MRLQSPDALGRGSLPGSLPLSAALAPGASPGEKGNTSALDALQVEALMANLDASLNVRARAHFFMWTQGLLQTLIGHEVLICALRHGGPLSLRADSFATLVPDAAIFGELFLRDAAAGPALVKTWKERRFQPVVCDAGDAGAPCGREFARELERIGATQIVAHGSHDADGEISSFFTFACRPRTVGATQAYLVQLAVPFLHAAWLRTQVNGSPEGRRLEPARVGVLTPRELEILRWIYLGKSNSEVGTILGISALTVKNHVQKILRKLDVVNRTQAVGKALDLRILSP